MVAVPFLLAVAVGLGLARPPRLRIGIRLERQRAVEGDEVGLEVEVSALRPVARLIVHVLPPCGLTLLPERSAGAIGLRAGGTRTFLRRLECRRWGGRVGGRVRVEARDPLGFFRYQLDEGPLLPLHVHPRAECIRRLLRPADTQVFAGNQLSRFRGDGIEFADVRPFLPGDRVRRINWRVSARRSQLHVNEMRQNGTPT